MTFRIDLTKRMIPFAPFALFALVGASAAAAPPQLPKRDSRVTPQVRQVQSAADLRNQVEGLLSGYEPGDPAPALRSLGLPAADVLLSLCQDPQVSPIRRLRAVEALGHVPTPAGLAYLRNLISLKRSKTDGLSVYEVAAAARALYGFGPVVQAEAIGLLSHDSADVREGAASTLAALSTQEAQVALRSRLKVEKESGVRAALMQSLRVR